MPLAAADLTQLGNTPITIMSNFYPNTYLRMDGTGVTAPMNAGGGTVNCEYGADILAAFQVVPQSNGSYAFQSVSFPGVYLRMDGTGVPTTMAGGGTVNCQFGIVDAGETFNLSANADGSFSFQSVLFPGIYLRMVTGSGVTAATGPGGTVNCQINASGGANESFFLNTANLNMATQNTGFEIQKQTQTMWCWDASTVSVAAYYNKNTAWTQCSLANQMLSRQDCCVGVGQVSPCGNYGSWPDLNPLTNTTANAPMQTVGVYTATINSTLTPAQISAQLARNWQGVQGAGVGAPFLCNISWQGGGGHIVVVSGRSLVGTVDHVSVADPGSGTVSDWVYTAFQNAYQVTGTWNKSYTTQPGHS